MIEKNKLLGLEILRFISACIVLFVHYHFLCDIGIKEDHNPVTTYPFYSSLSFLYYLSIWAVPAFWCLSGFIFFWKYQSLIASKAINFKQFFVSRFARLYPLHFLTLIIIAIGQAVHFHMAGFHYMGEDYKYSVRDFVLHLFMASNRTYFPDSFNWPVWSVSAEVIVYLIFFMVTRYVTKSIRFNFFIIFIFALVCLFIPRTHMLSIYECLLFFYTGGIASILKKYFVLKRLPSHLVWISAALIPLFFYLGGGFSSENITFFFWAIWLPILIFCASGDFKANELVRKIIETLGNMTYSSYLIHMPVQLLLAILCFHWKILLPVYNPLFLIGYLCLIFLLSYLIYNYFEVPMKKLVKAVAGREFDG
jgi:peptidoglycan/LPS O-acetylase OafA/YrhL